MYAGDLMMLVMVFGGAAFTTVKLVDAAVHASKGFYYNYGDWSTMGNNLGLYECIMVVSIESWAILKVVLGLISASWVWETTEKRIAEATEGTTGLEVALTWDKAVKIFCLEMLIGIVVAVSGYDLGSTSDPLIAWFDQYDDDTKTEGDEKEDSSNKDPAGTSAERDIIHNIITTVYWVLVNDVFALGAFYMLYTYGPLSLVEDNF